MPEASRRRNSAKLLEDARHNIMSSGPQGEQVHYDERGNPVTGGGSIEFRGYELYEDILERMSEGEIVTKETLDQEKQIKETKRKVKRLVGFFGANDIFNS